MKKQFILPFLFILLFSNCEKVIEVDVPSIEPKLVIDASFEVFFDENPVTANTTVKLSLSADYFEDEIPPVTNATVTLTNLSDNTIIPFVDTNADGNFKPINPFIPADDITYELTVIYENETYKGKATKIKSTVINTITQGDDTLFSDDEIELKILFSDNIEEDNYYLFNIDTYNFVNIEDTYFNGSKYNFSYFYEDENIELPKEIEVKLSGISKEYNTYFSILLNQSGESGGGPFQSAPTSLLGNIINTTNETNFPLGYFHISETDTFTINLIDKE
ncbi:DUF4249 domain-containing protein [Polaribacter sp. Z014]|uniref:DUF4249 family protein n=1 Tax=unclassified Polaribacter TaxID=196858 RepID=UPI00193BFBAF|nr:MULTISPECIES: DUF4249 family protein [unclassified Polaribacter]MCL7762914.1 DUF4249 domain-containing protein [Polaribacter sp. Z014]QVY65661.1 DUF4249 domain-containing protein [Polaribacter sp. Q13]